MTTDYDAEEVAPEVRLVPAGTGLPAYKRLSVLVDGEPPVMPREMSRVQREELNEE